MQTANKNDALDNDIADDAGTNSDSDSAWSVQPTGTAGGAVQGVESWFSWDTNPLYAVLHESIYCQGAPSQWAAQRVRDASFAAAFDAVKAANANLPVMFTGVACQ